MNWKKYLLAFSSIATLVASEQLIHACADFDNYDTYPTLFGNKGPAKPAYTPFFYVGYDLYYDDYNDSSQPNSINKQLLLEEWQHYSAPNIPLSDIDSLLYRTDLSDIQSLSEGKGTALSGNRFATWLQQSGQKEVLQYLVYAKYCELNATTRIQDWDTSRTKPQQSNQELIQEGLKLHRRSKNDFLKMKYAFQVLRLAFYDDQYDQVLQYYNDLVGKKADKSIAYTRCIGFKAGAYYRKKEKAKAGYYYSRMFANHDAYKAEAMISYEWCRKSYDPEQGTVTADYDNAIYALCQDNRERAMVTLMNALRTVDQALPLIEQVYRLDPELPGIDILMNREINKIEEHYFATVIYDQNKLPSSNLWYYNIRGYDYEYNNNTHTQKDSAARSYIQYLNKLNQFSQQMIAEGKNGSKAFWHLSSAYIHYMLQQREGMMKQLQAAQAAGMNLNEQRLYNVIDIVATLKQQQTLNTATEAALLPKLKQLDALAAQDYGASKTFRDIMQHLIAGQYLQQKDTIKAVYAMAHAVSYGDDRNHFESDHGFKDIHGMVLDAMSVPELKQVQAFATSGQKTAFEQWLTAHTYYTPEVLTELEGTKYIREYRFKEAEKIFSHLKSDTRYASPFQPSINDRIESSEQEQQKGYTKLSFSQRMAELQDIIAKDPNDAGALYGYAVALYNISYYGRASNIVDYSRNYTDVLAYYVDDRWQRNRGFWEYYGVYTAEQYFNKAAIASDDPELRAKALWGAAKCWQKRCPTRPENSYQANDNYYINALKNPYFTKLKSSYSQTRYMQRVQSTCDYYGDYLRRK